MNRQQQDEMEVTWGTVFKQKIWKNTVWIPNKGQSIFDEIGSIRKILPFSYLPYVESCARCGTYRQNQVKAVIFSSVSSLLPVI